MRWKGFLIVAALIGGIVLFSIMFLDSFAKGQIESIGSAAVGAKVSLDDLDISIKNQSVSLKNLQVANPKDPWKNIFQLKSAEFDFSLPDILMGNLVIEKISADTPEWGTERKTSGELPKKAAPVKKEKGAVGKMAEKAAGKAADLAGKAAEKVAGKAVEKAEQKTGIKKTDLKIDWKEYFPAPEIPKNFDAKKYVNPEVMGSLKQLEDSKKELEGKDVYWNGRFKELENEFNEIKNLAQNGGSGVAAIAGAADAAKRIGEFRKKVEAAQKEFQADIDKINGLADTIEKLGKTDLKNVVNLVDLGGGNLSGLSQKLFEQLYKEKIEAAYNAFLGYKEKVMPSAKPGDEDEKKKRMKGQTIHFPLKKPMPRFLLKEAEFKTSAEKKAGNWFAGSVRNISSNQKINKQPTSIDMVGGSQDLPGADFEVKGNVNLMGKSDVYDFGFAAKNISPNLATESLGPDSPIGIAGGKIGSKGGFNLTGSLIKSNFIVSLADISTSARKEALSQHDPKIVEILDNSLKKITYINLKGDAKGTIKDLKVHITSDLDKILQAVINSTVAQARAEIERRIREELQKELDKRVPELKAMLMDENGKMKNLDSVTNELKNRFEGERKKLEQRARDELKKQEERIRKEADAAKKKAEAEIKKREAEIKKKADEAKKRAEEEAERERKKQEEKLKKDLENQLKKAIKLPF